MAENVELPEGFVLDDLPPRFVLDQPKRPAVQPPQQPFTQGMNIPLGGGDIPVGLDVGQYSQSLNQLAQPAAMWDAAKTLGASAVLGPASGIAGIAAMTPLSLLTGGGLERANDWVQAVQGLIPQPQTPGGQAWTGAMNAPNMPFEAMNVGNRLEEMGAPWYLSAFGETAARAVPVVALGASGLKVQGTTTASTLAAIDRQIASNVRNTIPKIVRPSVQNVRGWTQVNKKLGAYEKAIPDMVKNTPEINLDTALMDASKANYDTKISLWKQEHEMIANSGKKGAFVDYKPFYEEGLEMATSDKMYKFNPAEARRLKDFITRMYEVNGRYVDPLIAEQDLVALNDMAKSYWKSTDPQYLGSGVNNERLAHSLRQQTYKAVDSMQGENLADLRNRIGAQMAIEKELSNRALVDLRKPDAGFFDVVTAPAVGDFLSGLLTLRPAQMIRGAGMYIAKGELKRMNNGNVQMYKLWNKTRDLLEKRGDLLPQQMRKPPVQPLQLPEPAWEMGTQGQLGRGPTTLNEMYPQRALQEGDYGRSLPNGTINLPGPNQEVINVSPVKPPIESPPKPYATLVPKPIGRYKAPEPNIIAEYMKKLQRVK